MADRDPTSFGGDRPNPTPSSNPTYGNLRPEAPRTSVSSTAPQNQPQAQTPANLRQQVQDDVHAVRDMAKEQMDHASAKAQDMAEQQKGYAAERVAGIADAIQRVGSELEQGENREIGRVARQMGQTVQRFAEDIKGKNMSEVAGMAEDFGRRQPLAFLSLAAMAGLAASRFIGASASRQASHTPHRTSAAVKPAESLQSSPSATLNSMGASNV